MLPDTWEGPPESWLMALLLYKACSLVTEHVLKHDKNDYLCYVGRGRERRYGCSSGTFSPPLTAGAPVISGGTDHTFQGLLPLQTSYLVSVLI